MSTATKVDLLLDSGAFSAWRLGKPVVLADYCKYVKKNLDWVGRYVSLDVISPGDPETAARASFKNYEYMRAEGLAPMPVFHPGEDISWLQRMVDSGADCIGLGGTTQMPSEKRDAWFTMVWAHLVNADGLPIIKVHALGEGRPASLKRFPWYSADSTSWLYAAQRLGKVVTLDGRQVSMRNDGAHSSGVPDLDQMGALDEAAFNALLREAGIKADAFAKRDKTSTILRTYLTALFYIHQQQQVRALQPIRFRPQGFFSGAAVGRPAVDVGQFKLHLVIGGNELTYPVLAKLRHSHALASYFYLEGASKGATASSLTEFVRSPVNACKSIPQLARFWKVLEENLDA